MADPVVTDYTTSFGGSPADPKVIAAFAAGEAWARKTLGLAPGTALGVLGDDNRQALYGYVADVLKLPKAQFGYYGPDDIDGLQVVAGDIGRRYQGQLVYGLRTRSSFA